MFLLNKVICGLANPTVVLIASCVACFALCAKKRWGVAALVLLWLWMTPLPARLLGVPLEREWLVDGKVPTAESFPQADAIVLLGGGMGGSTNIGDHAEMWTSADRVWQAARLWQAGKAPRILVTGGGNEQSTKGLLADFGVATNAMVFLERPRNTEEEAREVAASVAGSTRPKVLLVTSAWHMRRAKLMFEKYAKSLDVVPAPADFEATVGFSRGFRLAELLPSGPFLTANEYCFHEWLGYFGYKYLR